MNKKTNIGLVEYCRAQIGRPYWYGTFGQKASEAVYDIKRRQYPRQYAALDYPRQYGQKVHDCVGLIEGYFWCDDANDVTPVYCSNSFPDVSADMLASRCKRKSYDMKAMPEVKGLALFTAGHVGVYAGNGKVIEARNHKTGVIESNLSDLKWRSWAYIDGLEYVSEIDGKVVLVDNGHGWDTKGKCSPDKTLREWEYARIIARGVVDGCKEHGIDARLLVTEDNDISLDERCRRVNEICKEYGRENVCLLSIHVDAAGGDGQWHDAGGWTCYTTRGETVSDRFAECMYDAAEAHLGRYQEYMAEGKKSGGYGKIQKPLRTDTTDGDRDREANYTILYGTQCAAILTENMFQDNRLDVAWLLSREGKRTLIDLHVEGIINYIKKL